MQCLISNSINLLPIPRARFREEGGKKEEGIIVTIFKNFLEAFNGSLKEGKLFLVLVITHIQAESLQKAIKICLYPKKAKQLSEDSSLEKEKKKIMLYHKCNAFLHAFIW